MIVSAPLVPTMVAVRPAQLAAAGPVVDVVEDRKSVV
jgi:hypothetical protein